VVLVVEDMIKECKGKNNKETSFMGGHR
jgi:hypothetical protein